MDQQEEIILVREAKNGSDEAFTHLFQMNYQFLYKYLIKLTLQKDLTEDLIQETMLKAYTNLSGFKGSSKFSTWLISIASRLFIDYQRKRKRENVRLEKIQVEVMEKIKWNLMRKGYEWSSHLDVFSSIEPEIRAPILLKHYYGFTNGEIAKMLNLKEGTVKTRIHYGLKRIRKEFES
ncbi:RNA polymerase sigma factor SigY [Metabacillus niabensis]|uniref:RNA polymerase sigma factor n=1 Tax=Metabacillus niabensis TaxID=324854 RepID=A0ABT9Z7F6_9BACI|nr:RNA polymerase sigma factor SigY [Metabacillus niabensis]MDQ0228188.1 RNA polymerase sigma-70 factor (ECF subfamily) [Metabacillus niabensis]